MKKLCSLLLAVCLIIGIYTPARAAEVTDPAPPVESETVPPPESEGAPVVVGTLGELQAAIDAAEDGDTIALSQTIYINGENLFSDKDVTVICADGFSSFNMVKITSGSIIGLSFRGTVKSKSSLICIEAGKNNDVLLQDCIFDGMTENTAVGVYGEMESEATIKNCEFKNCYINAVHALSRTKLVMENCYVHDNYGIDATGSVQSSGTLALNNCVITQNTSFANAGVLCNGTLSITDCQIENNTILNPDKGAAVDVFCSGVWSITDEAHDGAGYYYADTGEKVSLPVAQSDVFAKLIYLSDEAAKDYFVIEWTPIEPAPVVPMVPIEPAPVIPMVPIEPAPIIPATPLEPSQKPDGGEEDTDLSDDYRPSHKPTKPQKPVDTIPMEEIKPTHILTCGNAVIDISRSVVLEGYGDGLLHESDPLSRAQMTAIIYRLLNDESMVTLSVPSRSFTDVDAADWYAPFVLALADAGIVGGTGEGYFAPNSPTTWAQLLTVLGRFVEPQECPLQHIQYDGWARLFIETAVALGWIEDSAEIDPDAVITRGKAVDLINYVLQQYK